jgi:1-acyl-sn-glycerol-3-phosphate acyltransferase
VSSVVPSLPPNAPRSNGNAFTRWVGRTVLRVGGWRMVGEWPDVPKAVVIVAPHTSAWDGLWGLAAKVALGLGIAFMGKQELFGGPLGWLLRKLGGFPVDRQSPGGIVDQVAAKLQDNERMWLALAPEGTRKPVERWKSGFWKIATRAQVPVFCVWFHYPDKVIGLGPMVELTDDMEADLVRIRELFRDHQGKNRGVF